MDSDTGGLSSTESQRQSAAEAARKKVLAVYSSTVQNLKKLPTDSRRRLIRSQRNQYTSAMPNATTASTNAASVDTTFGAATSDTSTASGYNTASANPQPEIQPNWMQASNSGAYSDANTAQSYASGQNYADQNDDSNYVEQNYVNQNYANQNAEQYVDQNYADQDYAEQNYSNQDYTQDTQNYANTNAQYADTAQEGALKDAPIDQEAVNAEWQKYHSAWQDYYKNYYSDYYAKAAQAYLATEKMKTEHTATGSKRRVRNIKHLIPVFIIAALTLTVLFLQYNRQIFAPIMAYISPDTGSVSDNISAIDSNVSASVSPEPRLIIPKLNVDVPVAFGISNSEIDAAMNQGVAQFSIPGANALPGEIGNLAISGHSAGDIYSNNPYKFIFSGLERLETGDLIYINYESVRYTYQMTGRNVVEPTDVAALVYDTDRPMLTLITCTPLGTSRYRLLISAEQISPAYSADNTSQPIISDNTVDNSTSEEAMPSNPPSFFENIWHGIFGG